MARDLGGTVRQCTAAETLERVRPLFGAVGITRLANVTGLDRLGIPVWLCVRPRGRALSVSQGKGLTDDLAKASAVMESIELYHAERIRPPDVVATARAIGRRHAIVDPAELSPGIRWSAYRRAREIGWTRGTDLGTGELVMVPHAWVDLDWTRTHPEAGLFDVTSTGLASGNHRLEALCHALFEVVERDCEERWNRLSDAARQKRRVNADTVDSPMLRWLLDRFARAGTEVSMWDMTSKVGLPAFRCTLYDPRALGILNPFYGAGCHLSPVVALARALTEAAQCRLTYIAGSRDDLFPSMYERTADPSHEPGPPGTLDFRTLRAPALGATFEADLSQVLRLLAVAGFRRAIAIDHTRPDLAIPVVTTVVPGMREVA
jgi:ribosomal protein S12 methylthiotransferase accessory factor